MFELSMLNALYLYIAINSPLVILATILYLYSKIRKHRAHYFEFHDLSCCPSFIREFGTNFLNCIYKAPLPWNGISVAKLVLPHLQETLKECNSRIVLDLGSGSGGVVPYIQAQFNKKSFAAKSVMTDLFPNIKKWDRLMNDIPNLSYIAQSIDALKINQDSINNNINNESTRITRSMFTFMHHLRPSEIEHALNDIIDHDQGFFAFKPGINNISEYLLVLLFLFVPLFGFITTFTMRPYPWKTILLFPVTNWIWMHDGIVSYSRLYSAENWLELATECSTNKNKKYQWDVKNVVFLPYVSTIRIYSGIPLSDRVDV